MSRPIKILASLVAFVAAVAVATWIAVAIFFSNVAEMNLIAFTAATRAVSAFIDREGRWPNSLEELRTERDFFGHEDQIRKSVQIAFDVSLEDVAKCTPENFPYIVISQPTFPSAARERVRLVIATAKAQLPADSEPPRTKALMP